MRLKFLLATIASHLVMPLPVHAINALLATLVWLVARTAFLWFMARPRRFAAAHERVKALVGSVSRHHGVAYWSAGHWGSSRG